MNVNSEEKYSKNAQNKDEEPVPQVQSSQMPLIATEVISSNVKSNTIYSTSFHDLSRDSYDPDVMQPSAWLSDVFYFQHHSTSMFTFLYDFYTIQKPINLFAHSASAPTRSPLVETFIGCMTESDLKHADFRYLFASMPKHHSYLLTQLCTGAFKHELIDYKTLLPARYSSLEFWGEIPIVLWSAADAQRIYYNRVSIHQTEVINLSLYSCVNYAQLVCLILTSMIVPYYDSSKSFLAQLFITMQFMDFGEVTALKVYQKIAKKFEFVLDNLGERDMHSELDRFNPFANGFGKRRRLVSLRSADKNSRKALSVAAFLFLNHSGVNAAIPVSRFAHEVVDVPQQSMVFPTMLMSLMMILAYLVIECPLTKRIFRHVDRYVTRKFQEKNDSPLASAILEARSTLSEMYNQAEFHQEAADPDGCDEGVCRFIPIVDVTPQPPPPQLSYRIYKFIANSKFFLVLFTSIAFYHGFRMAPKLFFTSFGLLWFSSSYFEATEAAFFAPLEIMYFRLQRNYHTLKDQILSRRLMVSLGRGRRMAEKDNEEAVSVASTCTTDTLESDFSVKKIKIRTHNIIPVKSTREETVEFVKTFGDGILDSQYMKMISGDNISYECVDLMRQFWLGPSLSTHGRLQCCAYYGMAVQKFLARVILLNKGPAVEALNHIFSSLQITLGFEDDSEPVMPSWLEGFQENLSKVASVDKSAMHEGVTGFLSLLAITPIFYYEIGSAETYVAAYKSTITFLKKGGISVQAIMGALLKSSSAMFTAYKTGNLHGVLQVLITPDLRSASFIELSEKVRKMKSGLAPASYESTIELCNQVRALELTYKNAVHSGRCAPIDESRYKLCMEMSSAMHHMVKTLGAKKEPYAVSLRGEAGIGKSVYLDWLIEVNAKRLNRSHYCSVGMINLTDAFHSGIWSNTTDIKMEDCNNIKPEYQKTQVEAARLDAVNTVCRPILKAEAGDKGMHFFLNEAVWDAENAYPSPIATIEPSSYYRRLGYCVDMKLKREYADSNGRVRKGIAIPPNGEHCMFRRFKHHNTGYGKWEERWETEWMEAREFLTDLWAFIDTHIAHEEEMLRKRHDKFSLVMCPCNVMPESGCRCSLSKFAMENQDLMTARSYEEETIETPESDPTLDEDSEFTQELDHEHVMWFTNIRQTKPTMGQGLASWIYLMMLGDGRRAQLISILWNNYAFEMVGYIMALLAIFLCPAVDSPAELLLVSILLSSGVTIVLSCNVLRRKVSYMMSLTPLDALGVFSTSVTTFGSRFFDTTRLSQALYLLVGAMLTKTLLPMLVEFFIPARITTTKVFKDPVKNKVYKLSEVETVIIDGEQIDVTGFSIEDYPDIPIPKKDVTVEGPLRKIPHEKVTEPKMWEQINRVRPSAHHCARTITVNDMIQKIASNTYVAKIGTNKTVITMLNGSIAMTASHGFIENGDLVEKELVVYDHRQEKEFTYMVTYGMMSIVERKDVILIFLPGMKLGMKEHLRRFFPISKGKGDFFSTRVTRNLNTHVLEVTKGMHCKWAEFDVEYPARGMKFVSTDVILVTSPMGTRGGMCGSLYVNDASPRVITGMHFMGNKASQAFAVAIFEHEIARAEEKLASRCNYITEPELGEFLPAVAGIPQDIVTFEDPKNPAHFVEDGNVDVVGNIEMRATPRSCLVENPHLEQAKRILGLKHVKVRPIMQFRRSMGRVIRNTVAPAVCEIPAEILKRATDHYIETIKKLVKKTQEKYPNLPLNRPLTEKETLNGIEGTPLCRAKTSTSGGWPGNMSKGEYFDEDSEGVLTLKPELRATMDEVRTRVWSGSTSGTVTTGCLKDEAVKLQNMLLARMFNNVGICEYLLASENLAAIMQIWSSNPVEAETAIGLNRLGPDWYPFISSFFDPNFIDNVFDGDFKEFDMHQNTWLKMSSTRVFREIARTCGWDPTDIDHLTKVAALTIAPMVNVGGYIVTLMNLFLSGILWTALGNGEHTSILMRCSFIMYCGETGFKGEFTDHFRIGTLGDDLKGACSKEIRQHGWTPEHLQKTCAMMGLTITNSAKNGPPGFMHAAKSSFLSSVTHYHEETGMNVNVVGPESYLKSFHLFLPSKSITYDEYNADLTRSVLMETYYGGRQAYDCMRDRLLKYFAEIDMPYCSELHDDYDARTVKELAKIGGFQNQPRLVQNSELGMDLIREYDAIDDSMMSELKNITREEYLACADKHEIKDLLVKKKEARLIFDCEINGFKTESEAIAPDGQDEQIINVIDQGVTDESRSEIKRQLLDDLPLDPRSTAENMLMRRQQFPSLSWTENLIGGLTVVPLQPYSMMSTMPILQNRLQHVAGYRADIKITFAISAPATVAGSLLATVFHYPDGGLSSDEVEISDYQRNCAWSQRQHLIMIAGNGDGIFTMTVPWFHKVNFVHVNDTDVFDLLPTVRIKCLSPLVSAFDTTPTIHVAMFMEYVNLKTYGATSAFQAGPGSYQYFGSSFQVEVEENPVESFSGGATALSVGLAKISTIPGLGGLALPAKIANAVGGAAHKLGFSKPALVGESPQAPSTITGHANIRGKLPTKVISPDPAQNVSIGGKHMGIDTDELSMAMYTQKYSIIAVAEVSSSSNAGAEIYAQNVTPSVFLRSDTVVQPASCAVPSMFFNHWVGTMQYRMTLVSTTNISGWLMMSWDPLCFTHAAKDQDVLYTNSTETVMINLAETRQWEMEVNWGSALPALTTLGPLPQIGEQWKDIGLGMTDLHNGALRVLIHQPITTSVGKDVTFSLIVESRCGANIKFFDYHGGQVWNDGMEPILGSPSVTKVKPLINYPIPLAADCETMPICAELGETTVFLAPPRELTTGPTVFPGSLAPNTAPPISNAPSAVASQTPSTASAPSWLPSFLSKNPSNMPSINESIEPTQISSVPTRVSSQKPSSMPSTLVSSQPSTSVCEDRNLVTTSVPITTVVDYGDSYFQPDSGSIGANWTKVLSNTVVGDYTLSQYSVGSLSRRKMTIVGYSTGTLEDDNGPLTQNGGGGFYSYVDDTGACNGCELYQTFYPDDPAVPIYVTSAQTDLPYGYSFTWNGVGTGYTFPAEAWAPHTNTTDQGITGVHSLPEIATKVATVFAFTPWIVVIPVVFFHQGELTVTWTQDGATQTKVSTPQYPNKFTSTLCIAHEGATNFAVNAVGGIAGYYTLIYSGRRMRVEADEPEENKWFTFGSKFSTDDVPAILAGEHMQSFRSLMKIAVPVHEYRFAASPGNLATAAIKDYLFTDIPSFCLYQYMQRCYTSRRGGLCYVYHIKGDGSVEFSRCYSPAYAEFSGKSGTEVIDSRVNPTGVVKFPYSSPFLYDYAMGAPTNAPDRHLNFSAWNGLIAVKESMFIAEDFSFFNFRGAAAFRMPAPP